MKKFLFLILLLLSSFFSSAQCEWKQSLKDDLYAKEAADNGFLDFFETDNVSKSQAYKILYEEANELKNNLEELADVSKHLDDIDNLGGYSNWRLRIGRLKHPNWVQVDDITTKVLAKEPHVLKVETKADGTFYPKSKTIDGRTFNMEGFKGCHSENALKEYIQAHGGTYAVKNKSLGQGGVYEGQPIIYVNDKEYVKINGRFVEYESGKLGGTSSFFPEEWSNTKIKQEVEHAIKNNHGLVDGAQSEYFGFSTDGKVEIHFYLRQDGGIGSYFPKKR